MAGDVELVEDPKIQGLVHQPSVGRGDLKLFYLELNGLSGARSGHT